MRSLATTLLLCLALATTAAAQAPVLETGRTHSAMLAAGATEAYDLELPADWFVSGRVYKDGVDVAVTVTGPDGERVARFASPVGLGGPEAFRFSTGAAGRYRIEVSGRNESATGPYRIRLERQEPVATTPEGRVDQAMTFFAEDTPGAVVAVLRDGRVEFARGYGSAHLSHGIPFTERTPTNIGSTSKQFTGFALALLQSRGALSLEDDIRQYIPELPDFGHRITVRNLLSHTTGFREIFNLLMLEGRRVMEGDYISSDEVIEVVRRQPELQNVPGTEYNYNNTAFALATVVVERVTGRPFAAWMRDEVFVPLGMHDTLVRAHAGQIVPRASLGYTPGEGGFREARDLAAAMGAGAVYTTPVDLAKWMDNFRTGVLGGTEVIRELTTPNLLADGRSTGYGLGLQIGTTRGLARWQHGGADIAHRSTFVYFPELNAGYVVLSNYAAVPAVGNLVAEAFFGAHMTPVTAQQGGNAEGAQQGATPAVDTGGPGAGNAAAAEPVDLEQFAGRYFSAELEAFYDVAVDEDRLVLRQRRIGTVRLTHTAGDVFSGTMPASRVEFVRDDAGRVTALRAGNGRARDVVFERVTR